MGICSSSRSISSTNKQTNTSPASPWQFYESKSKLNHSFHIPLSNEHIFIPDHLDIDDDNIEYIKIPLTIECRINPIFSDTFNITAPYTKTYLMKHLFSDILAHINNKHKVDIKYQDIILITNDESEKTSFCNEIIDELSLIHYDKNDIETYGLKLELICHQFQHTPHSNIISCPAMKEKNSYNPYFCHIYQTMKLDPESYVDDEDLFKAHLYHLDKYNHLKDEHLEKEPCEYHWVCPSFKAQQNGTFSNFIYDKLHLILYKHPPRRQRQFEMEQNIHPFITAKNVHHRYHFVYNHIQTDDNDHNDILTELVEEIIENGFGELLSTKIDNIMNLVKEKLNCLRHKMMWSPLIAQEMLALVLYVNHTKIAYDISQSQLNGNYSKWKYFDRCLYDGIHKLSQRECGSYKLYCAANNIKMDRQVIKNGIFPTYISTSWKKENIEQVIENEGIIIEMDHSFRNHHICCDVSWISLFPDECEILIARDVPINDRFYSLTLKLLHEMDNIQHAIATFIPH